jgi:hypothetical protein
MAAAKLAIWLDRNGTPAPINAQNRATSRSGGDAVARKRFNVSGYFSKGAQLADFHYYEARKHHQFVPRRRLVL